MSRYPQLICLLSCICLYYQAGAQVRKDTTLLDGGRFTLLIDVVPCEDPIPDRDPVATISMECFDTLCTWIPRRTVFDLADSISLVFKVPPKLVYEIGMNESRWPNPHDLHYLIYQGDLQVMDRTFQHFYKILGLSGGKTRKNYLIVGIYYLSTQYERYHSWQKARYAYGRGHWKEPVHWTALERKFMGKIDWTKYD